MRVITDLDGMHMDGDTVATIGKFDGVHIGHQLILDHMAQYAKKGYRTVVFTFDKNPAEFFSCEVVRELTPSPEKRRLIGEKPVDYLVEFPFTQSTSNMEPEYFLREILLKALRARIIVAGPDVRFGHLGRGDKDFLLRACRNGGPQVVIIPKKCYQGREISSSYVREEVEKGRVDAMPHLLGRYYSACGEVLVGNQLGRTLGMPTVNLLPEPKKLLPPNGVYLSTVKYRGGLYPGISNIGCKPTVSKEGQIGVETYLYDFDEDLYGEKIEVCLLEFLRGEQKFSGVAELKKAMEADIAKGRKMHLHRL